MFSQERGLFGNLWLKIALCTICAPSENTSSLFNIKFRFYHAIISDPTIQALNQFWAIFKILPLYLLHVVKADPKSYCEESKAICFWQFSYLKMKNPKSFSACILYVSLLPLSVLFQQQCLVSLQSPSECNLLTKRYLSDKQI